MQTHVLDLTLPAVAASVARARTELCDAMAPELEQEELDTLRLLVSELVTNAVRHADGSEPVEVHAHWDGEVRIEVSDHGRGFSPTAALRPPGRAGRVRPVPRGPPRGPLGRGDRRRHDGVVRLAAPLTDAVR